MQLKECTEDTADNKVRGDWMLINLCVLHSAQYFCISSSLLSCSWLSRPPLKGMTRAPGSWPSTHSLIFSSLAEMETWKRDGLKLFGSTQEGLLSSGAWIFMAERLSECTAVCGRLRSGGGHFVLSHFHFKQWKVSKECDIKWILEFVYSENVLQTECSNSDVL